jgi:hypothetical protein
MKPKKTFKSLEELSADSIAADPGPEKPKSPKPQVFAEPPPKISMNNFPRLSDVRGYHRWGINE